MSKSQKSIKTLHKKGFEMTPDYYYSGPISPVEEEMLKNLIVDDTIYAWQIPYLSNASAWKNATSVGYRGLCFEVLQTGIDAALKKITKTNTQRLKNEAIEWVKSDDYPMSFGWLCDQFHLETERARRQILRIVELQEQHAAAAEEERKKLIVSETVVPEIVKKRRGSVLAKAA